MSKKIDKVMEKVIKSPKEMSKIYRPQAEHDRIYPVDRKFDLTYEFRMDAGPKDPERVHIAFQANKKATAPQFVKFNEINDGTHGTFARYTLNKNTSEGGRGKEVEAMFESAKWQLRTGEVKNFELSKTLREEIEKKRREKEGKTSEDEGGKKKSRSDKKREQAEKAEGNGNRSSSKTRKGGKK